MGRNTFIRERRVRGRVHLCATCRHCRLVQTPRSTFHLCGRHALDPGRFPKYPRVPVLRCPGHEEGPPRPVGQE